MNFLRLKHFVIFLFFIQIQSISAQTNSSNTFNPNRVWNDFLPSADCFFESDFTNNFNIRLAAESAPDVVTFATPMVGDMTGDGIPEILILAKPTNKERLGFSWYEWDYLEEGKYGSVTYITRDINVYNYQTGPPDQLVRTGIVRTPDLHFEGPNPFLIAKIPQLSNEPLVIVATSHLQTTPGYAKYKSRLIAYRLNNTDADDYVWISKEEYGKNVPNGSTGVQYKSGAAPGIADFNGDGIPEVYIYNEIFSLKPADNGKKLTDGGAFGQGVQLTSLGGGSMRGGSIGVSVAADVIPGGNLELVAGKSVYELDGSFNIIRRIDAPNVNGQAARDGFTSIADINRDGVLDVIITTARTDVPDSRLVYVWTVNGGSGILIARQSILDAGAGVDKGNVRATGLAFIGDIDKNGTPEIGLTSPLRLWMFYYDGTTTLKSKWTGPLITADRSGYTLITMFDFDQDGKQELVYRDESTLRIIDGSGASPTIKSSIPVGAATAGDGAVIADVNQDGEADIIVTNQHGFVGNIQDGYFGEPYAKLAVFRSDGNPWAPSRSVWNQYAYFNFNVNDDLTIPVPQLNHGTVASVFFPRFNAFGCLEGDEQPFNSFLVQTTLYNDAGCKITGDPLMDAQIELDQARFICYTSGPQIESIFTITNAGNALLPKETPISFYVDNVFILVKTLAQLGLGDISPDQSEEVTLVLDSSVADNLVSGSQKLKAIINWDNASQKFVYDECIYDNEFIAPIISRPVYEVESPQPVCEGESVFLEPKKSSYVDPTTGVPVESVESTQLKWYKDNVSGSPITNGTINGVSYTIDPINFSLLIEGLPASSSEQIFILVDGCTGRKVSVPVTVSPMPAISFEIQDVLCNGENTGRITNIIGDQSYLSYSLDGTTFITGNQLKATNFSAGIFTVTVIASQNSSASCEATFTFEITEPDPIVLTNQVITPPSCDLPNGTYSIDFEGGKTPYKLTLTKGSGVIETVSNLPTGTYTKSDLAPGSYLFTVTDANGCTISDPFILTNDPKQSINIVLADQEICEGQNVTLIPEINTGGNPRVVTWFYDALGTTKLVNGPDPKNGNISYTITGEELVISGLPSGAAKEYYVRVSGDLYCPIIEAVSITVLPPLTVTITATEIICFGDLVDITASATGGDGDFLYSLNGGATQSESIFKGVSAGDYTVTVTSANCTVTSDLVSVKAPPAPITLQGEQTIIGASCNESNGIIQNVVVTGGWGNYTIEWKKDDPNTGTVVGNQIPEITGLAAGNYFLVVKDSKGCVQDFPFVVNQQPLPDLEIANVAVCEGEEVTLIPVQTVSGASQTELIWYKDAAGSILLSQGIDPNNPAITYTISDESVLQIQGLPAGTYTYYLEIVCSGERKPATVVVSAAPNPVIEKTDVVCFGESTGKIKVTANSNANFLYSVNGAAPVNQSALEALSFAVGDYSIVITETGTDCSTTEEITIDQPEELIFKEIDKVDPACGVDDGIIEFEIGGGLKAYGITINKQPLSGYQVTENANVFTVSDLAVGQYDIQITDANGCIVVGQFILVEDKSNTVESKDLDKFICEGEVAIFVPELTITGSVTPKFTWFLDSDMTQPVTANYTAGGTGVMYEIDPATGQLSIHNLSLGAEDYFLQITDEAICTVTSKADVTVSAAPNPVIEKTDVVCFGDSTGKLKVTSNSNANYLYSVNGAATINQSALEALSFAVGDYSIVITETGTDCSTTEEITIDQPEELIFKAIDKVDPACGVDDGIIEFEIGGGLKGYGITINKQPLSGYQVTENANVFTVSDLAVGQYDIQITDANGCIVVGQFILVEDKSNTVESKDLAKVFCEGEVAIFVPEITITGSVTPTFTWYLDSELTQPVTANYTAGGTGIMYEIDPVTGQLSIHNLGLGAEDYFLQITDEAICTVTSRADVTVTISPNPVLETTDILCFGESTGKIKVTANSNSNYLYSVNGAAPIKQAALEALEFAAGDYTIVITETGNDCSTTEVVKIAQPEELIFKAIDQKSPACGVNDGTIQFEIVGGTEDYIITINNKPLADYKAVKTDQVFTVSELALGQYDIRVTDANGCKVVGEFTLLDDNSNTLQSKNLDKVFCEGEVAIFVPEITITGSVTPTFTWFLDSDMTQPVTANYTAGGTGVMYEIDPVTGQLSIHNLGLGAEDYFLQITDEAICTVTSRADVTVTISPNPVLETTDILCFGESTGKIKVTSNSNANYLYSVNGAAPIKQAALEALEFSAGDYTIVITETGNDCSTTETVKIAQPEELIFKAIDQKSPACGVNDGTIQFEIAGGTEDYIITINNKPLSGYQVTENNNVFIVSELALGQYDIRVTDANGCKVVGGFTLVDDSSNTLQSKNLDKVFCEGEVAIFVPEITITGSVTPTFTWFLDSDMTQPVTANYTAGGTGVMYEIDPVTGQLSIHNLGLGAEDYFLQITDEAICTVTSRADVKVTISPNPDLETTDILCFGESTGKIKVTSNSNTNYLYSVNGAASIMQAALEALEFAAGDYTIVITETGNDCSTTEVVKIAQPEELIFKAIDQKSPACGVNDGTIQFEIAGGTEDYIITINNKPLADYKAVKTDQVFTVSELALGQYDIRVTDANGCKVVGGFTLVDDSSNTLQSKNLDKFFCEGELAIFIPEITITGSVTPTFTWFLDSDMTQPVTANYIAGGTGIMYEIDPVTGQLSIHNLGLGDEDYFLQITDEAICTVTSRADVTVTISPNPVLETTDILCFGESTGKIKVTSNSNANYLYSVNGAAPIKQAALEALEFAAGDYTIVITETGNDCSTTEVVKIVHPEELIFKAIDQKSPACGVNDGTIQFEIAGGTEDYNITINNKPLSGYQVTENNNVYTVSDLALGQYDIRVTDANGCKVVGGFTLVDDSANTLQSKNLDKVFCEGEVAIFIPEITITGSVTPTFTWFLDSDMTQAVTANYTAGGTGIMYEIDPATGQLSIHNLGLGAEDYFLQITDEAICTVISRADVTVTISPNPVLEKSDVLCFGESNGKIKVTANSNSKYLYSVNGGATIKQAALEALEFAAGDYTIVITENGTSCSTTEKLTIAQPEELIFTKIDQKSPACGLDDGMIKFSVSGGVKDYIITVNNLPLSDFDFTLVNEKYTIQKLKLGQYDIVITDANGCKLSQPSAFILIDDNSNSVESKNLAVTICKGEEAILIPELVIKGSVTPKLTWYADAALTKAIVANYSPSGTGVMFDIDATTGKLTAYNLPVGINSYYLEITDDKICALSSRADITVTDIPSPEFSITDILCFGEKTGKIKVSAGSDPTLLFSIDGAPRITLNQLEAQIFTAGTYQIKTFYGNATCGDLQTIEIIQPDELKIEKVSFLNSSCGENNGELVFIISGGVKAYTVLINGQPLSSYSYAEENNRYVVNKLTPGKYTITSKDANGCVAPAAVFDLVNLAAMPITAKEMAAEACEGSVIKFTPDFNSGSVNPTKRWFTDASLTKEVLSNYNPTGTGIMYQIAPSTGELSVYNLSAGNHTYYLQLSDPQICTISVKAIGTVNAGITGEAVATGIVCFGDITGSISVKNLNGGSGNYEFSLDNITWQSNPLFENLKAGSYKVYVRDIGGQLPCQLIIPTVIVEGPAKPISINPDPSIINASCGLPNGIISNIAITGGWGAYQVEWRKDSPTGTLVTGNLNTAENLAPGKYYLIVKDSLGCSEVFNFEITALKDPLYSIVKPADFCAGESITLEAINSVSGAATTNYVWSKGPNRQNPIAAGTDPVIPSASYSLQEIDSRLLLDIQGLPAGTYKYYLFIECTSQELLFEFTVKASPVLEIDKSDISCFGAKDGKIFVKSGGSSDFTFSINNGPSITQTALESTKFQKGIYKVVVSNSIGCSSQEYTIEIKEPALLEITDLTFKNNACGSQNGEINVKWLGGTAEYTVQLLQNGNVISSKKVSTLATSFNNLASGSYEVSILDANLCSIKGSAPIEIVDGPSEIIADDLSICVGDIAIIQPKVIPENVNAIYSWYWGSILPANKLSNGDTRGAVDIQITSSGEIKLAGMAAGNNQTLWVTVSGAGICEGDEHKVLVSVKNAPTFTATSKDELCYGDGGSIQITSADLINLEFSLNSGAFAKYPNGLINKLVPGTYTLQGRYSTGCVTNFGQTITIVGPSKPLGFDDFKVISSSCNAPDGEISGILGGGTGPYTISLNNSQGVKVSQDIQSPTGVFSFSGLLANSYQVVAIDRNGCQISDKAVQLTEKTTVITADDVTICEGETAVIQASYSQDSPNVIFNWFYDKALTKPVLLNASADSFGAQYESTDQGNLSITSLPARNAPYSYFIQVAGQGICPPEVKEVKVRVSPLPTLRVSNPSIVCDPDQSVDLTQFIEGYNPNIFDYIVTSPVGVSLRVDQLSAVNVNGSYIVQAAFKGNSCFTQIEKIAVIIATTRVQSLFNYQIEISNTNILVNGDVQVFEDVDFVDASSGEVIIWNWEFGDGNTSNSINPTHQYTEPGQFVVKLTTIDKYGCTSEYQRVIDIFNDYQIIIPNAFTPDGGKNQYFIPKYRGISSMEFYVFTTWGELIFEANSLETIGWDGTFRGKQAINGNYVYKAVFKTRSGEVVERAGVFILIR
ncbi:PKD domain-containing protein [Algoriphagus ratkowskyi]|uniref:PKD domain-containing protein n=1 Tax=Algoriphagus ratkowskyi TaxID=57028 RepID=UPI000A380173|nr:PKD domain-containing protein [Algoriphagus ratkowskyi]